MIGLALAGGGVKGSYEAGAYNALKKCHVHFDGVTGTSIGAFNAAMIAAKKDKELTDFWFNVNVASILGINNNSNNKIVSSLKVIFNRGFEVDGLEKVLKEYDVEKSVRKSNIDFGLCTFKINNQEAIELFKKQISDGKLEEYIIASCFLPIFVAHLACLNNAGSFKLEAVGTLPNS